ncbi:MAG: hydrogenase maturation protease [Dehalococcoidales bacterium]|nr:hydrogenase maturation protease [Dehalococcoidales bacterium]
MNDTIVKTKIIIVGMGNPILSDDAVGIRLAQYLKKRYPELEVIETSEYGIGMLDYVCGYDRLVIIDSIKSGGQVPEVYKLELQDLKPESYYPTSHGVDIATAFNLGEKLGYQIPRHVCIYAIEVADNTTFAESCTPTVEACIPSIAEQIIKEENLARLVT